MDKSRFTANPQLDSEGFVMPDARCHGCAPDQQCSRSGTCEWRNITTHQQRGQHVAA